MERQEQPTAPSAPMPEGDCRAVVQHTQVLLLAGETWVPQCACAACATFAHEVLSLAAGGPLAAQLIFFLCRPTELETEAGQLQVALGALQEQLCGAPGALVGVVVEPRPAEEVAARQALKALLCDVFRSADPSGQTPLELHTAIFCPGHPDSTLQVQRVTCSGLREDLPAAMVPGLHACMCARACARGLPTAALCNTADALNACVCMYADSWCHKGREGPGQEAAGPLRNGAEPGSVT
uniref:Uncharacterized protein n=1 Tax=Apteryx owenii TaxID=8824 RepID=A0A8B9PV22_APTOW